MLVLTGLHRLDICPLAAQSLAGEPKVRRLPSIEKRNSFCGPSRRPMGGWRLPVAGKKMWIPRFLAMLIAYEDHRFYAHPGVDPLGLGRAALQWASHGHIVSGGSTLTMQVARAERASHRKIACRKAQSNFARDKDRTAVSKAGVLDLYLRLAPYGGQLLRACAAARSLCPISAREPEAHRRCARRFLVWR